MPAPPRALLAAESQATLSGTPILGVPWGCVPDSPSSHRVLPGSAVWGCFLPGGPHASVQVLSLPVTVTLPPPATPASGVLKAAVAPATHGGVERHARTEWSMSGVTAAPSSGAVGVCREGSVSLTSQVTGVSGELRRRLVGMPWPLVLALTEGAEAPLSHSHWRLQAPSLALSVLLCSGP